MKDLHVIALGRPFVKRFPFAIGPLYVLSVTLVYCGHWPNGWMEQYGTLYGGRPHPRTHCSKYNMGVQAHILHTGATVHLWRATIHIWRTTVHPWAMVHLSHQSQGTPSQQILDPLGGQSTPIGPRYTLVIKFSTAP